MIYLDHNATTPVDGRVIEAMMPYLSSFYGNPSSLYRMGRLVRSALDTAREQLALLVDAQPSQIIFTSGGTEANNLALNLIDPETRVAVSDVEHPSVIEPVKYRAQHFMTLPVDRQGVINFPAFDKLLMNVKGPCLISVMLANNENGAIQDVKRIVEQLIKHNAIVHTDAVQAAGKIPVSFRQLGVDLMSLSGHKIYGPKGTGALVINKHVDIKPLLVGGGQEFGLRAGTENVAAIVGFGKAAELALKELNQRATHCSKLKAMLERGLKSIPGLTVFAEQAERLPNTIQFGIAGMDGEMLQMQLDQKNIAVSSGSACSSGGGKPSPVLLAMDVEYSVARSAIRVSLGKQNTEEEVMQFIKILKSLL